jgi:hypothetical protein
MGLVVRSYFAVKRDETVVMINLISCVILQFSGVIAY